MKMITWLWLVLGVLVGTMIYLNVAYFNGWILN